MVSLIATSPVEAKLPVTIGNLSLSALEYQSIHSVALTKGGDKARFKSVTGLAFPGPGRSSGVGELRAIRTGPDQAFLLGDPPKDKTGFAVTDQSDGWTIFRLEGAGAEDALARLTPIDLRKSVFKRGHTARTLLNHLMCSITRTKSDVFDIMVFRSMSLTALHELQEAMRLVAARLG